MKVHQKSLAGRSHPSVVNPVHQHALPRFRVRLTRENRVRGGRNKPSNPARTFIRAEYRKLLQVSRGVEPSALRKRSKVRLTALALQFARERRIQWPRPRSKYASIFATALRTVDRWLRQVTQFNLAEEE